MEDYMLLACVILTIIAFVIEHTLRNESISSRMYYSLKSLRTFIILGIADLTISFSILNSVYFHNLAAYSIVFIYLLIIYLFYKYTSIGKISTVLIVLKSLSALGEFASYVEYKLISDVFFFLSSIVIITINVYFIRFRFKYEFTPLLLDVERYKNGSMKDKEKGKFIELLKVDASRNGIFDLNIDNDIDTKSLINSYYFDNDKDISLKTPIAETATTKEDDNYEGKASDIIQEPSLYIADKPIFCRKCGTRLQEDSMFCHKCGERVIK